MGGREKLNLAILFKCNIAPLTMLTCIFQNEEYYGTIHQFSMDIYKQVIMVTKDTYVKVPVCLCVLIN